MVTPTNALLLAFLATSKVDYLQWVRFIAPLFVVFCIVSFVALYLMTAVGAPTRSLESGKRSVCVGVTRPDDRQLDPGAKPSNIEIAQKDITTMFVGDCTRGTQAKTHTASARPGVAEAGERRVSEREG